MPRPTEPKIRKMRSDLDKMRTKLLTMRADALSMAGNPTGANVEICKDIKGSASVLDAAASMIDTAVQQLEYPQRILLNRSKK